MMPYIYFSLLMVPMVTSSDIWLLKHHEMTLVSMAYIPVRMKTNSAISPEILYGERSNKPPFSSPEKASLRRERYDPKRGRSHSAHTHTTRSFKRLLRPTSLQRSLKCSSFPRYNDCGDKVAGSNMGSVLLPKHRCLVSFDLSLDI